MAVSVQGVLKYNRQIESLIEAMVGMLLLVIVNYLFFPDDPGFLDVSPHPFMFLTILVAARYGTFDGFMTGLMCAVVFCGYYFFGRTVGELDASLRWTDMIPAYLFIILGLLLGEIRGIAEREVRKAKTDLLRYTTRCQSIEQENLLLRRVKEELQEKVLSSDDPLSEFYESARKLSMTQGDATYSAILELIGKFTGAEKYSVYLVDDQIALDNRPRFRLKVSQGWTSPEEFPLTIDFEHPAVKKVMETRSVTVLKETEDPKAGNDIIICAPMFDGVSDSLIGIIVINRISFVRITHLTITHMQTIGGWAAKTIGEARRFDNAMSSRVDEESTGTYNFKFLAKRLAEEVERVRRYSGGCCYVLLKVMDFETLRGEDSRVFLAEMGTFVKSVLRNVDVIGVHRRPGQFGLILPATNRAQAVVVTARINEGFRKSFSGYGSRFAHLRLKMGISIAAGADGMTDSLMMEHAERFDLSSSDDE